MKLSTRTRYGIRAVLELAQNNGNRPLQLRIIAQHQDISVKYLEQLMAILRSAGFVRSIRGAKGGYLLAKPPNQVKISDVFDCLEGHIATVECVETKITANVLLIVFQGRSGNRYRRQLKMYCNQ